ncbi:MAG: type II secretion system F family protein [Acetobacteraceae bacterium]
MTRFAYRALSASGDIVTGELDGPDVASVIARLNEQSLLPIQATEKREGSGFKINFSIGENTGFPQGDLALFIQQLTRLLTASLPLDRALEILTSMMEHKRTRAIVSRLLERVRDGSSLAEAMAAEEKVFPNLCVSMVRAGEEGGALRQVLARVGDFLVRSDAIRQKVISALIYPAILLVTAVGSVVLILTLVLPQFESMFQDAGAKLPGTARLVMAASQSLREDWWLYLLAIAIGALAVQYSLRMAAVRLLLDRLVLHLPIASGLFTRLEVGRFCRALGVLLANGVPAVRGLALAGATVGNRVFADAIETMGMRFNEGEGLAKSLAAAGCFPNLAVLLVQIGEETGRLEDMLQEIADIYDQDVERVLERLLALLVPGITILMGVVVAFIIAAVMTAMVSINELV